VRHRRESAPAPDSAWAYYTRVIAAPIVVGMVGFLLSADAASAPGATSIAPVRIDCAALDGESRSALEARTRAEIALLPQPAGTVVVTCRERNARIEWLPATTGPVRQRAVALEGPNDAVAVDRLLDAIHELRAGPTDPRAAPPALRTTAATPAVAARSADVSGIAAARSTRRLRMGVIAAARAELWEGAIAGGVAGELGLRLATRAGWSITAAAALGGGAQTARGIQASMVVASIAGQHPISSWLELAIGGEWRRIGATGTFAGAREEQHGGTFGGFAALRYVLSRGPLSFAAGPDLAVLATPIAVDVGGGELFRIPRLVAGLSLSGAADILR
jgi:hypothetical protein